MRAATTPGGAARRRRRAPLVLTLAFGLLAAGLLGPAPASPGGGVRQDRPVERVISVVPAATEALFAMGAGELVVAVGSYDAWPPEVEGLPRVGAYLDPDVEGMIGLRPDLAVIDAGQASLARQLEAAGISTFRFGHGDLDDALETMRSLGAAVGRPAAGRRLAGRVRHELESLRGRLSGRARPEVLLVFGGGGSFRDLWVVGGAQFLDELLEIAGGRNVFGDVERLSFSVGLETVLSRRPEVVLEIRSSGPVDEDAGAAGPGDADPDGGARHGRERAAVQRRWRQLPGFDSVRAEPLPGHAGVPGPRMPETARLIARALHGEEVVDDVGREADVDADGAARR